MKKKNLQQEPKIKSIISKGINSDVKVMPYYL